MPLFLLAILLGMLTYWVIQRSVASITRTPVWLLWFVMMVPVFVLTLWLLRQGTEKPPMGLVYGLFILCPLVYAFLIALGRVPTAAQQQTDALPHPPERKKSPPRPITPDEETVLQRCFPWSVYYLQNIEYRAQAMICRGKLKAAPGIAYQTVQRNIQTQFNDRFLVLFQEGSNGNPFFVLVPNPQKQGTDARRIVVKQPGVAIALLVTTLLTTTLVGLFSISNLTLEEVQSNPTLLWQGLPTAVP
jgi:hypothetical protein